METKKVNSMVRCPTCLGSGKKETGPWEYGPCTECSGHGKIPRYYSID